MTDDNRNPRALLVEDNPLNRELATDLLEVAGFEVCVASTGPEAVEMACLYRPDILVLDIRLPGLDGLGVLRDLRNRPETCAIPVVACTAHTMLGDEQKYLFAGCAGYIAKPLDTRTFAILIRGYLEKNRG